MEIGSIFELDLINELNKPSFEGDLFNSFDKYPYRKFFNSGRSAIRCLEEILTPNETRNEILMPAYLCLSILEPLKKSKFNVIFYNVSSELRIDLADLHGKITARTCAVFYISYFGFLPSQEILDYFTSLTYSNIKIIEDATHSIFTINKEARIANYIIASIRKWIAIPDGGIIFSKEDIKISEINEDNDNFMIFNLQALLNKYKYMLEPEIVSKRYIQLVEAANLEIENDITIRRMSKLSELLLKKISPAVMLVRIKNYQYLLRELNKVKQVKVLFDYQSGVIPLGFPICIEDKNLLREYLIENMVYCPVHWPLNKKLYLDYPHLEDLYGKIITIPIDQRYSLEDMKRIVALIKKYYDER